MDYVRVKTQAELDKVAPGDVVILVGNGRFEFRTDRHVRVEGSDSPEVIVREEAEVRLVSWGSSTLNAESRESSTLNAVSWGSSTLNAVSWGSSTLRAVSWGSSTLNAVSWGSSTLRAVSWGSSTLNAVSRGSSTLRAVSWGSSTITGRAGKYALTGATQHGNSKITLPGAVILRAPEDITTAEEWFEYNGCEVKRGRAIVYKLVNDEWRSAYGTLYEVGKETKCDDWNTNASCGNGLHFSPSASGTERYADGTHYLACSVRVKDVVLLGDKLKAPSCRVLYEVDRFGDQIGVV